MTLDLGALVRSAALSGSGYFEGQRAKEERERQRQIEDEERERARRDAELAEQERMIRLSLLARDAQAPPPPPEYSVNIDGISGKFTDEGAARAFRDRNRVPDEPTAPSERTFEHDGIMYRYDPTAGSAAPIEGVPQEAPSARNPTEVQTRFQIVLPRAEAAIGTIERLLEGFGGRVPESTVLGRFGVGQYATPADEQAYNQAAEALATAILRAESGAAITKDEVTSYRRQFIPDVGDRPEVIQQKLEALRVTLQAMRAMAGPSPGGGGFSPGNPYAPGR